MTGRPVAASTSRLLQWVSTYPGEPAPEALLPRTAAGRRVLVERSCWHRVSAAMHISTSRAGLVLDALQERHQEVVSTHLRVLATLRRLSHALGDVAPWVVLKGPVLASNHYPRPDLRDYHDVDVLVAPRHVRTAIAALQDNGFQLIERNWAMVRNLSLGELHLLSPDGVEVDLHHDLVHHASRRRRFRLVTDELMDRAVTVDISGETCRTLDPVDSVVHLCVHTALAGGDRLGWFSDVHQVVLGAAVDWSDLTMRSHAAQVGLPVHGVLSTAAGTLGTPIPEGVLRSLAPAAFRASCRLVDRLDPPTQRSGHLSLGRNVARGSSASVGATMRQVATDALRRRLSRGSPLAADLSSDSRSLHFSAADSEFHREQYLRELEASID